MENRQAQTHLNPRQARMSALRVTLRSQKLAGRSWLMKHAQSLNLGFNFGSLCIYFDARKESDGLPSENLRSVSRRSIGLYRAKYCRDVEVARIDGSGDIFLTGYCKAEMKTRERYHIKVRLAASGFSSDGKIDDLKFASCQCKGRTWTDCFLQAHRRLLLWTR